MCLCQCMSYARKEVLNNIRADFSETTWLRYEHYFLNLIGVRDLLCRYKAYSILRRCTRRGKRETVFSSLASLNLGCN